MKWEREGGGIGNSSRVGIGFCVAEVPNLSFIFAAFYNFFFYSINFFFKFHLIFS